MQWPIPEEWRRLARDAMKKERLSQTAIADRLGISQSTVHRIFHGPSEASEHVPAIARMLRISPPMLPTTPQQAAVDSDAWCESWRSAFDELSPVQRHLLLALCEELKIK